MAKVLLAVQEESSQEAHVMYPTEVWQASEHLTWATVYERDTLLETPETYIQVADNEQHEKREMKNH